MILKKGLLTELERKKKRFSERQYYFFLGGGGCGGGGLGLFLGGWVGARQTSIFSGRPYHMLLLPFIC